MSNDVSRDDSARNDGSTEVEISEVQVVASSNDDVPRPSMLVEVIDSSSEDEASSEAAAAPKVEIASTDDESVDTVTPEPVVEAKAEPVVG